MSANFPRLLVATEFPPNASGGGPAVVRQMLKGWPVEKLFWWSCLPEHDHRFGQKVATHRVAIIPPKLYPNRRWCRQKSWLMEKVWSAWAVRHLRAMLGACKPDAVWVIPHSWAIPPLAGVLPQSNFGFHTTVQDFMDANGRIGCFGVERSRRLTALADKLYSSATTRDATSHPMIADLRARTGCEAAQMLHAGLEAEDFAFLSRKASAPAGEIRIAYAGTIIVESDFVIFVEALARIHSGLPVPVKLRFFGAHSYRSREWFDPSWMEELGNLPEPQLADALKECTWGFAPMALSDDDPRYNRFSFPTKFISYLAAGLPVITLGHPESSVVKVAQTYRVGPCITSGERRGLDGELLAALALKDPGAKFAPEILRCGRGEFDAERMRKTLWRCLFTCAEKEA